MDNKKIQYDDVILMQYADGELDESERLHLEKDLENNKNLQDRLAVFALTRDDLTGLKERLPKHIEDLIDEQDRISSDDKITRFSPSLKHSGSTTSAPIEQDGMVVGFFKNYPVQSLAASVMFGLMIGSQGMKELYTAPYNDLLINNPVSEYQSASNPKVMAIPAQPITRSLSPRSKDNSGAAIRLLGMLNQGDDTLANNPSIKIVSDFKNTNNYECKLAETGDSYLIACKNKSGNWTIRQAK